jgi:uncharacterized metal-binding protein
MSVEYWEIVTHDFPYVKLPKHRDMMHSGSQSGSTLLVIYFIRILNFGNRQNTYSYSSAQQIKF